MNKQEFLARLREGISGLPKDDIEERMNFYSEIIDDRIEDGLSEEAAIEEIGPVEGVISQIVADTPLKKLVKEKMYTKRRLGAAETVLLIIGSPIWLSLLIAIFAVVFSLYAALWSVIISIWAAFGSVVAGGVGSVAGGAWFAFTGNALTGLAAIGVGIFCVGFSVFMFFGCREATKGMLFLTKKLVFCIKNRFASRGNVQ